MRIHYKQRADRRPALWRLPARRQRVPVQLQLSAVECGAASLAMILSYHGRATTVTECRMRLGAGRDGATALEIAQTARTYGLEVRALSVAIAQFHHVALPAIIHWEFNHFVVVERWSPRWVDVVDPAVGRRRLSPAQFDAGFTGVALTFAAGPQFVRRRAKSTLAWHTYLTKLWQSPGLLAQVLAASLALQLLGLALPLFTQVIVDSILPSGAAAALPALGVGLGLMLAASALMTYLRATLLLYLRARLDTQMMQGFFAHILRLPFPFFEQRSSGDLLARLNSNVLIRELLTNQMLALVLDGVLVLVYLALMLAQAPTFGALVLLIGLLQVGIWYGATGHMDRLLRRDIQARTEEQNYLVEAISGIATIKAAGAEQNVLDHWSGLFFQQLQVGLRRDRWEALLDTCANTLRLGAPLLLLWLNVHHALAGQMSVGHLLALNTLAVMFLMPLDTLARSLQRLQMVDVQLERLSDVLEAAPEQRDTVAQAARPLGGRIEIHDVSFRYAPNQPAVLEHIDVTIEPGQHVAIVGRSGSGKSTLARLILGLYVPSAGEIRYDGTPLEQLNYQALRRQFGTVLQDARLFSGSIRTNIAFNNPDMPMERIVAAARAAAIHEEIMRMPMGYETLVSEAGNGLSGGQGQRLALARALAHAPAVVLLDEATSHLDVLTEQEVDANLRRLACTRIVVAHRLSTVCHADLILVLDQGQIVERGTHGALLARNGTYAAIIRNQLAA